MQHLVEIRLRLQANKLQTKSESMHGINVKTTVSELLRSKPTFKRTLFVTIRHLAFSVALRRKAC